MEDDNLTLRVAHTFFFDKEKRWLHNGAHITIKRAEYARYGKWCNEIVSGSLVAPTAPPPARKGFVGRLVEKAAAVSSDLMGRKPVEENKPAEDQKEKFPCSVCGAVFTAQRGLDLHFSRTHEVIEA